MAGTTYLVSDHLVSRREVALQHQQDGGKEVMSLEEDQQHLQTSEQTQTLHAPQQKKWLSIDEWQEWQAPQHQQELQPPQQKEGLQLPQQKQGLKQREGFLALPRHWPRCVLPCS